ncbi:MAG: DUF2811 domain-containing protein [Synechococcales bacterium]|nr:DUF2811 domain-containing protein [Synechococcales bacterium]
MNSTIALLAEVPESLHQELSSYLNQAELSTQRSEILIAALTLFLSQSEAEIRHLSQALETA